MLELTALDDPLQVAVACIKVASQAVSTMPSLFFFPILPFLMTVCLIVYWVVVAGYLYSAGTIMPKMTTSSPASALSISVSSKWTLIHPEPVVLLAPSLHLW